MFSMYKLLYVSERTHFLIEHKPYLLSMQRVNEGNELDLNYDYLYFTSYL